MAKTISYFAVPRGGRENAKILVDILAEDSRLAFVESRDADTAGLVIVTSVHHIETEAVRTSRLTPQTVIFVDIVGDAEAPKGIPRVDIAHGARELRDQLPAVRELLLSSATRAAN
jgi:hypothetical protein